MAHALHVFPDSRRAGQRLAARLGAVASPVRLHRFPDGESLVRVATPVAPHAVVVRSLNQPNGKLVEVVLAADALRRAGAQHVTLVAPYLPYMRQDAVFRPGEPLSQRVIGAWLAGCFDRVITAEAHLHRIDRLAEVMGRGARSVSAAPVIAAWMVKRGEDCLLVGPDEESQPWVRRIAKAAGLPWVVGRKERLSDRIVRIHLPPLPPCRHAVVVDDIASSGVTLAVAARALRRAGMRRVDVIVVHAIFAPGALQRIRRAGVGRVLSCDTVTHPTNAIHCAPLFAPLLSGKR